MSSPESLSTVGAMQTTSAPSYPETFNPHLNEWIIGSGVHPAIAIASIQTLSGNDALEALLFAAIPDGGHNPYYITSAAAELFDRYDFATDGGWWVSGLDPFNNWERMQWGLFKPDSPRPDNRKAGKVRKYENPPKTPSRAIFLPVPDEQAEKVYQRYGINPAIADRVKGFWHCVWLYNLPIIVTEGAKKAGCLIANGYPAISVPGIAMGVRTKDDQGNPMLHSLIPDLKYFATASRTIYLCFDHETKITTKQNVDREIEKLKIQFTKAKCPVKIISLPGPEKGVDDFIVTRGADAFHALYEKALSFEGWQIRRYNHLTYPASITLNQRYLGALSIPDSAKLIVLKSPKGTGKTESFVELVSEATRNGQRTLLISHRVQLAQAICDRVGLPFITEVRTSETGSLLGYGLCIDSLHPQSQARFNGDSWDDALIIVDECEQVFWHALSASTEVSNHRIPVLEELKKLLTNVVNSDRGRIILSDADLSNLSIEFVQALVESKVEPWVVANEWQPSEPWEIHHYASKTPETWLAALDAEIANGGRPFIVTQSQRAKSRWSTTTLEQVLKTRYPDKTILRIDSETIADPTHAAYLCTSSLNELLTRYDIVIASPSIETGVSIDVRGHFTSVWGCLNGVTPENSARQSLARVREAVPRHIWIARHGLGKIGSGSTSVRALLSAEYQIARVATKLVQIISFNEDMLTAYSAALKIWAKMAARINAGQINYRDAVLAGLQAEGHCISEASSSPQPRLMQEVQEIRDTHYGAECEAIATAQEMTQKEFEESKGKKAKTRSEAYRERKYQIEQRYQIEVTPDLVEKDDDGWHPKLRLYYFMTMGRQFLQERDRQALEHIGQTSGFWLPTVNRSQISAKVALMDALHIKQLLDPDAEFNGGTKKQDYQNAHPLLFDLWEMAERHRWEIKNAIGVTISEGMSPIQVAQVLLGKLGIKLRCDRQEGGRGGRQRIYHFVAPDDGRAEVLTGWFTRDEVNRNDSAVHTPGISKEDTERVGRAA